MNIRWLTSLGEMKALQPEWRALWDACPARTPFQSPEWLLPWMRHLFEGGEIRCGAIEDSGKLVGLAPFFLYGGGGAPQTLAFLGAGISDYGDVLAAPGFEAECICLVRDWIEARRAEGCAVDLQEIPAGSPLLTGDEPPCSVCPVLNLPRRVEELDGLLAPKLRVDLRRSRNRLSKAHRFQFEVATEPTLTEFLDALFRLHAARWQLEQEAGVLATPELQAFHRDAAAGFLRRGLLRLYVIRVDETIAAVVYGFLAGSGFFSYLSGFDPGYAPFSCGALLIRHAVESAILEGLTEFDFLRNPEAYKYAWGAKDRITYRPA